MIDLNLIKCNGCHSCYNICPKHCIEMKPDLEGFLYPKINVDECINCNLCEKVCPLINKKYPECSNKSYAAYNLNMETKIKSSSGGIFSLIATEIINNGGVVFGAAFDDDFLIHHISIDNIEDLDKLYGSKYVQSTIGDTYSDAKLFLDQGRSVLFSGTPCQIAGLKSFLGKKYENLFSLDVVCHGVPSPKLWDKYIKSVSDGEKLKSVSFRNKKNGWIDFSVILDFKSHTISSRFSDNKFMRMFLDNVCLRNSCYNCSFKSLDRFSDITLADFWGIEKVMPEMYEKNGTSLVITHTDMGEKMLDKISNSIRYKMVDIDLSVRHNYSAVNSSIPHRKRSKYLKKIAYSDFNYLYNLALVPTKLENILRKIKYKILRLLRS